MEQPSLGEEMYFVASHSQRTLARCHLKKGLSVWDWATLGTWKQEQSWLGSSGNILPQCLGRRWPQEVVMERKMVWCESVEKFKWLGAWTVKGMMFGGSTLPREEQPPLPEDYCGNRVLSMWQAENLASRSCLLALYVCCEAAARAEPRACGSWNFPSSNLPHGRWHLKAPRLPSGSCPPGCICLLPGRTESSELRSCEPYNFHSCISPIDW
jgi:hypothetical protein